MSSDSNTAVAEPDIAVEEEVETVEQVDEETSQKVAHLPQWKVILINDDVTPFDYVVRQVFRLTPLNEQDSLEKTLEAHKTGAALLLITHKEAAELYQDKFQSIRPPIGIEIEPAD